MSINVNVVNQKLFISSTFDNVVEGSHEFVEFRFNLDNSWDNLTIFAQFNQNGAAYNQFLDNNNCVYLPNEISEGKCTLVLYGTGTSNRNKREILTINNHRANTSVSVAGESGEGIESLCLIDENGVPGEQLLINNTNENYKYSYDAAKKEIIVHESIPDGTKIIASYLGVAKTIATTNYITFKVDSNNIIVDAQTTNIPKNIYEQIVQDIIDSIENSSTDNSIGCITPNRNAGSVAFGASTLTKCIEEGTIHEGVDEETGIEYNVEQVLSDLTNVFKYGKIVRLGKNITYTKQQLAKAWVDMDVSPETNPIFWYFDKQVYDSHGGITDPPRLNIAYEFGGFNSGTDNLNQSEGGNVHGIANIVINGASDFIEGLNNKAIDTNSVHVEGRFNDVNGKLHHVEGGSNYVDGEGNHVENSVNVVRGKYNHAESYDGHIISERGHIEGSGGRAQVGLIESFDANELKIIADEYTTGFKSLKTDLVLKIGLNYYKVNSVTKPKNEEVTSTSIATVVVDKNITATVRDEVYKVTHFNSGGVGHVEGKDNINFAHSGHVEGKFNILLENAASSHAGGTSNKVSGENTLLTGYFNESSGKQVLGAGEHNKIYADNAASIGQWNNARTPNGFVCGTFNAQATDVLLAVGNGTSSSDRRDAFQVKADGSVKVQGDIIANKVNLIEKIESNLIEAKSYTDNELAKFDFIKIVNKLPETGLPNRFYLVPKSKQSDNDLFDEYIWANRGTEENPIYDWEWVTTKQVEVDLTDYAKLSDVEDSIDNRIDQTFISDSENAVSGKVLGEVVGSIDQYIYDTGIEATQNANSYTDDKINVVNQALNEHPAFYSGVRVDNDHDEIIFIESIVGSTVAVRPGVIEQQSIPDFYLNLKKGDLYFNTDKNCIYRCLSVDVAENKHTGVFKWENLVEANNAAASLELHAVEAANVYTDAEIDKVRHKTVFFSDRANLLLEDNISFVAQESISSLTINYPDGDFISSIEFTTADDGVIDIVLPESKYIGGAPTFLNGETWELNVKNGVVVGGLVE